MVNKIDSNFTGLRVAEESAVIGVLPGSPVWTPLEPNGYGDFGAQITTLARTPIVAGRQRKKGVTVDLDSVAGFSEDFTQKNFYDRLQGFFFAVWRKKPNTTISAATGSTTDDYTVASEAGFLPSHLVLVEGMTTTDNNGLKLLNGVTAGALSSSTDLTTETSTGTVKAVGFQFAAGILSVNQVSAQETEYNIASLAAANKAYTISSGPANNDTVTIGSRVYTWKTTLTGAADEIKIGGSATISGDNMQAAINGAAGAGTTYGTGTVANTQVTALNATGTVTVTAIRPGASGNSIALAESGANTAWAGAATALSGGVGVGWIELGIIPGEWVYIGGDSALLKFGTAANNGFVRARTVLDAKLTVDKTQGTTVDEAGGSLTVQVFFGDVIKNESDPALIVRKSYQFERSLSTAGYEYIPGSVANTLSFAIATSGKVTAELSYVALDAEQTLSRKSGTFPAVVDADAFNTSSDFARLRLATKAAYATPLFAFLSELNLSINNGITPNKAVSVLGAFDLTAGDFVVEGTMNAYFADIAAVQAVRNNSDVSIDFSMVKNNAGWLFDVPLLSLGDGRLQVEKDQPIKIPLSIGAAEDSVLHHTLLADCFHYLPDLAE